MELIVKKNSVVLIGLKQESYENNAIFYVNSSLRNSFDFVQQDLGMKLTLGNLIEYVGCLFETDSIASVSLSGILILGKYQLCVFEER